MRRRNQPHRQNISSGVKIVIAYLAITYIIPFILNLLFDTQPLFRTPLDVERVVLWMMAFNLIGLAAVFISQYTPGIRPKRHGRLKPIPFWIVFTIMLMTLASSLYSHSYNLIQWRYSTVGLAQHPDRMLIAVLQMLLPVLAFWVIITDHALLKSKKKGNLLLRAGLILSLVLSVNGLGSAVSAMFLSFVLGFPNYALPFIFKDACATGRNKPRKMLRSVIIVITAFIVAQPVFNLGVQAKSGRSADLELASESYLAVAYLVNRHSVHMASAAASILDGHDYDNLAILPAAYAYRIGVILGLSSGDEKPLMSSYSRLALVQFADFDNINERGGSSPGVLATITMSFPLWFSPFAFFVYCIFLVKLLDFVFARQKPFTWIGAAAFAYFPLRLITDSPADFFLPGPVLLVMCCVALAAARRYRNPGSDVDFVAKT